MATINGTAGNDTLSGTSGDDTINGLGGNDLFLADGSGGADVVEGGTGNDSIEFRQRATSGIVVDFAAGTITGGGAGTISFTSIERVVAGHFNDSLSGNAVSQTLTGEGGADTLWGAGGVDTLWGGGGADTFIFRETGTANADRISDWASGSDTLMLDGSVMSALGANGDFAAGDARFWSSASGIAQDADDRIIFNTTTRQVFYDADGNGSGAAQLIATLSNATFVATDIVVEGGSGGGQTINGTSGNDDLFGDSGNDTLNGFAGNDHLNGAGGDDLLDGGDGADMLEGQAGNDTAFGGAGDDSFFFETRQDTALGQDVLDGGSGLDTLYFFGDFPGGVIVNAAAGTFSGPRPGDSGTFTSIEHFMGTRFADSITGDASANHIDGMGGDDTLAGGSGNDTLQGGFFGVVSNELLIGGDGDDLLIGGGNGNDTLQGGIGDDYLQGGWGSDAIAGDGGNDLIRGNFGNDTLTGGAGADGFLFGANPHPANAVLLTDFASGVDKLRLEASAMPALGAGGNFATGDVRFYAAAGATGGHDSDDRIIYNTSTGALFYDADGNGSGAAQLIATLQGAAALSATDIQVDGGDGPGQAFTGTSGNDSLVGTDGDDTLNGLGGNDTLHGRGGNDSLNGGVGNDSLLGGRGFDHFIGGEGNDTLNGYYSESFGDREIETDTLDGGSGDDHYYVDNAGDALTDSDGVDTVHAADMNWTLGAGFENLVLHNDVSESGFTGIGNELANYMTSTYTGAWLEGRGGNDTLDGGHVISSSRLFGGDGNDMLIGGGDGGNRLDGGSGNDTLTGMSSDIYVFSVAAGAANADRITNLGSSNTIELNGAAYTSVGFTGRFTAGDGRFYSAAGATAGHDADDRIVYDTSTGNLWLDADGSGSGAAQLIATLQAGASLAATQIDLVNAPGLLINGTAGNDSLVGTTSEDTINGLAGNDTIDGGLGADSMDGGAGNDIFYVDNSGDVVIELANGGVDEVRSTLSYELPTGLNNLTLLGSGFTTGIGNALDNVITGNGLSSELHGRDGNDTLRGGTERDLLYGENGNDSIDAGTGDDLLTGGAGNDTLSGGDGNDEFWMGYRQAGAPGYGQDAIDGGAGADWITFSDFPTQGALTIDLTAGTFSNDGGSGTLANVENVFGTESADRMTGNAGANTLIGSAGDDTLAGGAGNDTLEGGIGNDTFIFSAAPSAANADFLNAFATGVEKIVLDGAAHANIGAAGNFASGDARFFAGAGANSGQDASDRVIYNTSTGQLWYDADGNGSGGSQLIATLSGAPMLVATDIAVVGGSAPSGQLINGTAGNDTLSGGVGNDTMNGLGGNDLFLAGANGGSDTIDGGAGTDSIEFRERATSGVVVDFGTGTIQGGGSGTITFTSVERVVAGNFNDTLTGTAGSQTLTGQAGADTIWGAAGADTLWGGGGADAFIFREMGTANADRISDFASGSDKVQLDDSAFTSIGAAGNFAAGDGRFWSAAGATAGHDANDRVIYNQSTGSLYYDADGSGSGAAQLIATLLGNPAIAAMDIAVI